MSEKGMFEGKKTVQVGSRITNETYKKLEKLAYEDYRTINNYICMILENHIKEAERREGE